MKEHVDKYLIHGKACGDDYIKKLEAKIAVLEARNEELEEWVILRCNELGVQIEFRDKRIKKLQKQVAALKEIARLTAPGGFPSYKHLYMITLKAWDTVDALKQEEKT